MRIVRLVRVEIFLIMLKCYGGDVTNVEIFGIKLRGGKGSDLMSNKKTKKDYQITMENMEDVLDILEEYVEKVDEGIEKLIIASREASKLQERVEELRKKIKDKWRTL